MNVVTVSREYGAGGGEVGKRLAETLGWELLDRELLHQAAAVGHVPDADLERLDEKALSMADRFRLKRPPIWGRSSGWLRWWPVGLAHWGTLLLTDRAFFFVWSQPPLGRKGYVFDHNLLCFSLTVPCRAECRKEHVAGVACVRLLLTFGVEDGRALEILFPEEQAGLALRWEQEMAGLAERCPRVTDLRG